MLSKSSKWELGLVHFIVKFTILRFVMSRFECTKYFDPNSHCARPLAFPDVIIISNMT